MLACVEPGPHLIPARPCPTNSPERALSHTLSSAKADYDLKTLSTASVAFPYTLGLCLQPDFSNQTVYCLKMHKYIYMEHKDKPRND